MGYVAKRRHLAWEATIGQYPKSQVGVCCKFVKISSKGLARRRRGEFIQSFKEGLRWFRYFDAFMTQKQISVTDFLLVVPVICFFVRGDYGAFQGNTCE